MLQVICGFVVGLLLAGLGFGLVGGGVPGLIVAVVLAALGYIAASTLTEPERRIGKMLVSALPNGQKTADTIDAANARLNSIAMLTKQVRDPAVKAEANDFIAATKDLVQYVTRDTSAYPTLRHYITVYGEQTEKLLRSYVDVESSGARDQIATARIETIEALQVLEQTAAGELSRAVSAKTLGITADSDAIQRLARMDDTTTSHLRLCLPRLLMKDGMHPVRLHLAARLTSRTRKRTHNETLQIKNHRTDRPACGSGRGLRHAGVAAIATSTGRTDRTGEHHRLPGRRENRPVR
ncbi:hypothetical protein PMO97_00235 [Bifidobacterium longum]|nr:hypothetical protein [Bifidobacterium longum]MDB6594009.1 hypothetical protein [Bifidobacterium longum]